MNDNGLYWWKECDIQRKDVSLESESSKNYVSWYPIFGVKTAILILC